MAGTAPPARAAERAMFAGLFVLTVVTGVVDAASFLGLGHVFTANMTGNVLLLGFALTGSPHAGPADLSVTRTAVALVAFVAGASVGSLATGRRPHRPRLWAGFGAEWAVLAAALAVGSAAGAPGARTAVVALLGLSMGLQNAVVRRMGVADINTTVLTTTLGGLTADVVQVGGRPVRAGRRVATVVFIFAGAVAGGLLVQRDLRWALAAALALMTLGGVAVVMGARRLDRSAPPADRRAPAG